MRAACRRSWRRRSAPQWPDGRPGGHLAAAARPPGSARGAAWPAWRCDARSMSAPPDARPEPATVTFTGPAGTGPTGSAGACGDGARLRHSAAFAAGTTRTPPGDQTTARQRRPRALARPGRPARARRTLAVTATLAVSAIVTIIIVTSPALARRGGQDHRHIGRPLRRSRTPRSALRPSQATAPAWPRSAKGHPCPRARSRLRPAGRHPRPRPRAPSRPPRRPWAGAHQRRATSTTRRRSYSSTQYLSGVTCGGHATSPGRSQDSARSMRRPPVTSRCGEVGAPFFVFLRPALPLSRL